MSTGEDAAMGSSNAWGLHETPRRTWLRRGVRSTTVMTRALLLIVVAVLGLGGTALAGSQYGVADPICSVVEPSSPIQRPGGGTDSWFPNTNLAEIIPPGSSEPPRWMSEVRAFPTDGKGSLDNYTLYEVAGLRGLNWWVIPENADATENCNLGAYLETSVANFVFSITTTLLQPIIALKEMGSVDSPLAFLYDPSSGTVSGIFTGFFVPLATLLFVLSGIVVAVKVLRGGHSGRAALGGVLGVAFVLFIGGLLYGNEARGFQAIAQTADEATSSLSGIAVNAMYSSALADSDGLCAMPSSNELTEERAQRITSCMLAETVAYKPWAVGQFGAEGEQDIPIQDDVKIVYPGEDSFDHGDTGMLPIYDRAVPCYVRFNECKELRSYLIAQHGGPGQVGNIATGDLFRECTGTDRSWQMVHSGERETKVACEPMWAAWEVMRNGEAGSPDAVEAYRGASTSDRTAQAFLSLMMLTIVALAVGVVAVIKLVWEVMIFVYFLTGPFKLAMAASVGKLHILKEWFGDLARAWFAMLAYAIVLALIILVMTWIFGSALPLGMQLVFFGIVTWRFWKLVNKTQEQLTVVGGDGGPDVAGGTQQGMAATAGAAGAGAMAGARASHGGVRGVHNDIKRRRTAVAAGEMSRGRALATAVPGVVGAGLKGAGSGAANTSGYRFAGVAGRNAAANNGGSSGDKKKWATGSNQQRADDATKQQSEAKQGSTGTKRRTTAPKGGASSSGAEPGSGQADTSAASQSKQQGSGRKRADSSNGDGHTHVYQQQPRQQPRMYRREDAENNVHRYPRQPRPSDQTPRKKRDDE